MAGKHNGANKDAALIKEETKTKKIKSGGGVAREITINSMKCLARIRR
jgi:hypothetical protein